MKVFKFGGASLKNASAIQNVASIIRSQPSAEAACRCFGHGENHRHVGANSFSVPFNAGLRSNIELNQESITMRSLKHFSTIRRMCWKKLKGILLELEAELGKPADPDQIYDQVVSKGELISSIILHHYLIEKKAPTNGSMQELVFEPTTVSARVKLTGLQSSDNIQLLRAHSCQQDNNHSGVYWQNTRRTYHDTRP